MSDADGCIPWAQAVVLAASGDRIEFRCKGGDWNPVMARDQFTIEQLTSWEFRRARPKQSRAEDMADRECMRLGHVDRINLGDYTGRVIHSVCEVLRSCDAVKATPAYWADHIEAEFLEPRR